VVNIQSHNEETLLKLIKQGNDQAFTELYNRYWQKMLTIAFIKLQNTDDAKEVVQEVFIDIWNRRSHLNIRNSFYTYIATAVKYKVFTKIANRQKELQKRQGLSIDDKSHITEEWLSFEQLKSDLEKAIVELPEKCRLVFRLSREEGLTGKEIAEKLNLSPKTVETHISKALHHLRSSLRIFMNLLA
jgi:RNA polymerase sigma-70 factor (ECF subfamily)